MARGKLILIFGPTGSGKSVLIEHIKTVFPDVEFVKSYTTRERRSALENSSYEFISRETFEAFVAEGLMAEWAQFGSASYGTKRADIEEGLSRGTVLLKEMEVQGVRQMIEALPREDMRILYIDAGSWEELEKRARARGSITEEELAKRKIRYADELATKGVADVIIENMPGKVEEAKEALVAAVRAIADEVH